MQFFSYLVRILFQLFSIECISFVYRATRSQTKRNKISNWRSATLFPLKKQMSKVVGKKELLKWVADVSAHSCTKLEDLRDGVAFLKIFARIWPKIVNLKTLKWKVLYQDLL